MTQDTGRAHPSDRATRASPEPASGLGQKASVPCAFTPGPWYRGIGDRLPQGALDPKTHRTIAVCADGQLPLDPRVIVQSEAEREANANLIAAAPDLYEALNRIADGEYDGRSAARIAAHAILKLRGEQ